MAAKRALIVDDSLSARVVLSRMLQKYGLEVDTAESAESALTYLGQQRPDVIFMDHLMPGMDGFQAVQAIKNNPRTATIPIMMYTSQQGELYVGQARALGAVGVLPKLVKPVDVSKILYQLNLLPERRDASPPAFVAGNEAAARAQDLRAETPKPASAAPVDWQPQLEASLRSHDADLRRFMVANLDTFADRVVSDVRNLVNELPASQPPEPPPEPRPPYLWIAATLVALVPGIVLAVLHMRAVDANRAQSAEILSLRSDTVSLTAEVERLRLLESQHAEEAARARAAALSSAVAGGLEPIVEIVPYGEVPLALGRLDALHELLADLEQRSFHGVVTARYYTGRFCLAGSVTEGYALAPDGLPATRCDVFGNPFAESLSAPQRQSLDFANLAASVRQRTGGAIAVEVLADDDAALVGYPTVSESLSAGQWNSIAARNNRVEFTVVPAMP
jgi:CheY-like chemotaxis protein